jgi:GDP-L-fucose synthase
MKKNSKIYVAGHRGLVGSAIVKNLQKKGYTNLVLKTHKELDLTNQQAVEEFFASEKPQFVFLAAAKVGGIVANNTYRADFIYENLQIQNNVIHNAYKYGVKKLMFLGSTCIYPKNCPQPIKEEYLLTDTLEYTNEPYAIAKIAGIKMCESYNLQYNTNFISVMPTNLYGENDNFDLEKSHVLPALIRKIHLGKCLEEENWEEIRKDLNKNPINCAKCYEVSVKRVDGNSSQEDILKALECYGIKLNTSHLTPNTSKPKVSIEIWGSGKPMREFLYSDDMADACVYLMENIDFNDIIESVKSYELSAMNKNLNASHLTPNTNEYSNEVRNTHINIGTGQDISIKDLAYLIKDIIGYNGEFYFNISKPDGTMRKVTDVSKLHSLGWRHKIELENGIRKVYEWYTKE